MKVKYGIAPIAAFMLFLMIMPPTTNIQKARAAWTSGTIYIKADGSVEPWDAPIKKMGDTYLLTDDIEITTDSIGMIIEKDDIIINGEGHAISARSSFYGIENRRGIYLRGRRNIVIENIIIRNFKTAIYVYNSQYISIYKNKIENNKDGIDIDNSLTISIYENEIKNNKGCGIIIEYSSYIIINRNNMENNDLIGIAIIDSSNSVIHENKIKNSLYGISTGEWLFGDDSFNINISRNILANNNRGIDLDGSIKFNIYENIFTNCGISFNFRHYRSTNFHFSIRDNMVNGKPLVYLEDSSNRTVNDAGQVILIRCNGIIIKGLWLFNVYGSIQLFSSSNCIITENNIENGNIILFLSSNNRIFENRVVGVPDPYNKYKLYPFSIDESSNNKFFHNDFIVGTGYGEVYLDPYNIWDDGYPSGGNYWSNYRGVDEKSGPNQDQPGSDGIGDKPYSRDRYPFIKPRLTKFLKKTSLRVEINPPEITESFLFQSASVTISCRLTNERGEGLRERIIYIYIDNRVIKSGVTDSNGYYSYEWKDVDLKNGTYKITVKFDGDNIYSPSNASAVLTVKPAPSITEFLQPMIITACIIVVIVAILYLKRLLVNVITSRKPTAAAAATTSRPPSPLQPPEITPAIPTPSEARTAPKEPVETLKAKPPEQLARTPQATPRRMLKDGIEYYDFSGATLKGYTMGSKTHPRKEGQVEVGEFLGRGGYSIVYKGYIGGKPVAVKVCGRVERIDDGYYFSPPSKKGEIMDFFNQILTLGLIKRRMVLRQPNEEYLRELIEASVHLRNFNVSSPDELIGKYPVREWLSDLASYHHNIAMVKLFNAPFFEKFQRSSLDERIYSSTEEFVESPPFFAMQLADADLSKLPEMYGGSRDFPSILTAAFCQATAAISLVYACSTIPGEGSGEVFHPPRIHKDIKPGNILFKRHKQGFRFVVTDFGLAETQKRREKRWQIGTPYYMPPEYLLYPYESVLPTFDVYSLGATVLSLIARYDAPYLLIAATQHGFLQRYGAYREDALRRLKELYPDGAEGMVEEAGYIAYSTDDPFQLDEEAKRSRLALLQGKAREWGLYPLSIGDRIDGRVKGLLLDMVEMDYERRPKSILEVYFRLRALLGDSFTTYAPKKKEKISAS